MNLWNALPLFRLIIPFVIGIIVSDFVYFEKLLIVNFIALSFLIIVRKKRISYRYRWVFGVIAYFFFFGMGVWLNPNSLDLQKENFFIHQMSDENILLVEIIEEPSIKPNSYKTVADVLSVNEKPSCGKILLYLNKDLKNISYGSRFMIVKRPQKVALPSNPYQFNYSSFLYHRNISHQMYLSKDDIMVLPDVGGNRYIKKIISVRKNLLATIGASDMTEDGKVISSALLLGYKSEMNSDLKRSFSRSGVIHVLAVSGLHVGILYLLLNSVLGFMSRQTLLKGIKLMIILFSLWLYAFLTNLSPSVLRAATLFSFVAIGTALDRNTNIYNTLSASAFLLLIINPHYIYELGFQLSYLAVLGIVSIYPKIYSILSFKFFLWDKIWQLICVSLAAQLVTFPLVIYYFHQFPNYFLLSNLLVVPLIPIIIYSGIGFLLFKALPFLSEAFLSASNFLIELLVHSVRFIESLPNSSSDFLWINSFQVFLIYSIIAVLLFAIYHKKKIAVSLALVILIVLQVNFWQIKEERSNKSELIFYAIKNHTAFGLISGRERYFFMDTDLLADSSKKSFNLYNHWALLGSDELKTLSLDTDLETSIIWKSGQHIQLANSRIIWLNDNFKQKSIDSPIQVDYCLISTHYSIEKLIKSYSIKQFVFDATLPKYITKRLIEKCQELELPYHDLNTKGALLVDLKN